MNHEYDFQDKKDAGYAPEIPQLENIAIEASEKLSPQAIASLSIDEVEQELRRLGCDPTQRMSVKVKLMIQIHRSKILYKSAKSASSLEPVAPDLSISPFSPGSASYRSSILQALKALIKTIESAIIAFQQGLQRRASSLPMSKVGRKGWHEKHM